MKRAGLEVTLTCLRGQYNCPEGPHGVQAANTHPWESLMQGAVIELEVALGGVSIVNGEEKIEYECWGLWLKQKNG